MIEKFDFERYWQGKLSNCIEQFAGDTIRDLIMDGSEELSMASNRQEVIAWSRTAMRRLDALTDEKQRHDIMTGCACQYPKDDLADVRAEYQRTGNLETAHQMLQERFESFLAETLALEPALIDDIVARGWGLAGVLKGDTIIAIKIPKSGNLVAYMQESDPATKRANYCHCPRVREILLESGENSEPLSPTYCYCGAGYYRGIWEEIIGETVTVEVLESVLQGDDVCKIAIHLPVG